MVLAGLLLGAILTMWTFPDLPIGRQLRTYLVESPASWLDRAKRHHLIFLVILAAVLLSPAAIETVIMLGMADLTLFAWALDISLYVDAIALSLAITALSRSKVAIATIRVMLAKRKLGAHQVKRRLRHRARRQPVAKKSAQNDDEPARSRAAA